jgi:hypothetical protein
VPGPLGEAPQHSGKGVQQHRQPCGQAPPGVRRQHALFRGGAGEGEGKVLATDSTYALGRSREFRFGLRLTFSRPSTHSVGIPGFCSAQFHCLAWVSKG